VADPPAVPDPVSTHGRMPTPVLKFDPANPSRLEPHPPIFVCPAATPVVKKEAGWKPLPAKAIKSVKSKVKAAVKSATNVLHNAARRKRDSQESGSQTSGRSQASAAPGKQRGFGEFDHRKPKTKKSGKRKREAESTERLSKKKKSDAPTTSTAPSVRPPIAKKKTSKYIDRGSSVTGTESDEPPPPKKASKKKKEEVRVPAEMTFIHPLPGKVGSEKVFDHLRVRQHIVFFTLNGCKKISRSILIAAILCQRVSLFRNVWEMLYSSKICSWWKK
jgi:hypothetical protein